MGAGVGAPNLLPDARVLGSSKSASLEDTSLESCVSDSSSALGKSGLEYVPDAAFVLTSLSDTSELSSSDSLDWCEATAGSGVKLGALSVWLMMLVVGTREAGGS